MSPVVTAWALRVITYSRGGSPSVSVNCCATPTTDATRSRPRSRHFSSLFRRRCEDDTPRPPSEPADKSTACQCLALGTESGHRVGELCGERRRDRRV